MTSRDGHGPAGREAGVTLIELLIVLIIISVLIIASIVATRSARVASRNDAMKAAAASIDQAVGSFNRMYPAVPDPFTNRVNDQLVTRRLGQAWTGNTGNPNTGLADETGGWLLSTWPRDPWTGRGVRVLRYATLTSCNGGRAGEVKVCRLGAAQGRQTYLIRAWGKDSNGRAKLVYTAQHGVR